MKKNTIMLPETIKKAIPRLHTQDTLLDGMLYTYVRLTCEVLGSTWFILELHEDGDTFSGYWIQPHQEQFGYFSFEDMDSKLSTALIYDASFPPQFLVDAVQAERRTRRMLGEPCGFPDTDELAKHRAYYYAARYDEPSPQVFTTVRNILHEERPNLSVSTLLLEGYWYVVIIGDWPPERVHNRILAALSAGTIAIVPYELLLQLYARKLEANQREGWSEGHRGTVLKKRHKQKARNKRKG